MSTLASDHILVEEWQSMSRAQRKKEIEFGKQVQRAREALSALTEAEDGVEGEKLLMYGEGWDFGEVADNARGRNACQANLGGSSVGSFNDRFRDAALGPTAFGDLQGNGFLTGLGQAKEEGIGGEGEEERRRALELGLALRLGKGSG